jgi:hypothetical protein
MTIRIKFDEENETEIEYILSKHIDRILLNSKRVGIYRNENWKNFISSEALDNVHSKTVDIANETNLINFSGMGVSEKVIHVIQRQFPKNSIQVSGFFHYPNTGFMAWHTNSDVPCKRLYITWAKEPRKSFFRYKQGSEIITDYDELGFTYRIFDIAETPPYLWHAVGSETDRLSFGFRIL